MVTALYNTRFRFCWYSTPYQSDVNVSIVCQWPCAEAHCRSDVLTTQSSAVYTWYIHKLADSLIRGIGLGRLRKESIAKRLGQPRTITVCQWVTELGAQVRSYSTSDLELELEVHWGLLKPNWSLYQWLGCKCIFFSTASAWQVTVRYYLMVTY